MLPLLALAPKAIESAQAGIGSTVGFVGALAANAKDKMGPRIKELAALQGSGRLDANDNRLINKSYAAEQRAADAAAQQTADQLSAMGGASGRDVASVASTNQAQARDATDRASARFAQAFGAEGQELADRKAIRHDRSMELVNFAASALSGSANAGGFMKGAQKMAAAAKPDFTKLPADQRATYEKAWASKEAGDSAAWDALQKDATAATATTVTSAASGAAGAAAPAAAAGVMP